jgi:ABC-2 type transport system permease protein
VTAIATQSAARQPRSRRESRSAFASLVRIEAKLLVRELVPLLWGVGFPVILLAVIGAFSHGPDQSLGGASLVAVYVPILIAFTLATFALQGMPAVLAGYRDRGILRRLNATPVGAGRLLAAQLAVNLAVGLAAAAGILAVGYAAFGVALPRQPFGFLLALVLTAAAMLGLGLLIAAFARNGRVAGAVGTMLFLPMMFFAGLWMPQATMPAALRSAGQDTPLGAAVAALGRAMAGQWPSAVGLAALAGYALAFVALAWRLFRWE